MLDLVALNSYDTESDSFSKDIIRGQSYRFRFRAKNFNGWGDFSPISTIYAASRPDHPQPISLIASDNTSLSL